MYRRITESLRTAAYPPSAFRPVLDSWLFTLEADAVSADPGLHDADHAAVRTAASTLLERRLEAVTRRTPAFAQALRAYHAAVVRQDPATADSLASWLGGQPNAGAAARRSAGIRGELDHFGAMGFLQGLLVVLRDAGHPGLLLVLDEVETLQRVRGDVRDKAFNALRQLIDEIDSGRYPGLFLVITGTPPFYDGPSGISRLPPLAQRLATDFTTDARFDNPRAVLKSFDDSVRAHAVRGVEFPGFGDRPKDRLGMVARASGAPQGGVKRGPGWFGSGLDGGADSEGRRGRLGSGQQVRHAEAFRACPARTQQPPRDPGHRGQLVRRFAPAVAGAGCDCDQERADVPAGSFR